MPSSNTTTTYGGVAKFFHWLTALLILSALAVGFLAAYAPFADGTELARKATLFSLHKTIGVTAFFTALLRILWAFSQPRPKLLNGDHPLEALAAETMHWLLYGAMVLVPLTGWIHHAATTGFAPIWWPFGQSLPFVPKDVAVAELAGALHYSFMWLLLLSIAAHVAGAFKHLLIDRDQTLQRMLPGLRITSTPPKQQPGHLHPALAALALWAAAFGIGVTTAAQHDATSASPQLAEVSSDWRVQNGSLAVTVQQFGSAVTGTFDNWTAAIRFDETAVNGVHGEVAVTVAITSLTLGSVTDQALGADFLNATDFGTATFSADLIAADNGYIAIGTLSVNGYDVAIQMPFDLDITDGTATMSASLPLDRRSFHIGDTMGDESSLGFSVQIEVELTAQRSRNSLVSDDPSS